VRSSDDAPESKDPDRSYKYGEDEIGVFCATAVSDGVPGTRSNTFVSARILMIVNDDGGEAREVWERSETKLGQQPFMNGYLIQRYASRWTFTSANALAPSKSGAELPSVKGSRPIDEKNSIFRKAFLELSTAGPVPGSKFGRAVISWVWLRRLGLSP